MNLVVGGWWWYGLNSKYHDRSKLLEVILDFQSSAVGRVRQGYTGREPGHRIWTFSSSLLFSMAIFTTIGQLQITDLCTVYSEENRDKAHNNSSQVMEIWFPKQLWARF